eukprot:scaffold26128_cov157-Cylindrotheca_fusiformis.AAC.5
MLPTHINHYLTTCPLCVGDPDFTICSTITCLLGVLSAARLHSLYHTNNMEVDNLTLRRKILRDRSPAAHTIALPSKYPRFYRPLAQRRDVARTIPTAETRDDPDGRKRQRRRAERVLNSIDFTPEGIIRIEVPRESMPGISFSRYSSKAPLQVDYIHSDSTFASTPLVPGLIVDSINNQEMTYCSPQRAQDELVNEVFATTTLQVYGYVGKIYRATMATKFGLVLKDSTAVDGIFISDIKSDSLFYNTGLRVGLKVHTINKLQCPADMVKVIRIFQRTTGDLEIVAVDPNRISSFTNQTQDDQIEGRVAKPIEEGLDERQMVFQQRQHAYFKRELSALLESLEQSSMQNTPTVMNDDGEQSSMQDTPTIINDNGEIHEIIDLCDASDDYQNPDDEDIHEPLGEHADTGLTPNWPIPEPYNTPNPTVAGISYMCQAFAVQAAEFMDDHRRILDNWFPSLPTLFAEKNDSSPSWREIDARTYSKVNILPSVVNGAIGQPLPPMRLRIPTANRHSPFCRNGPARRSMMVNITLPEESFTGSLNQDEPLCGTGSTGSQSPSELVEGHRGSVRTGRETPFRQKRILAEKKMKRAVNTKTTSTEKPVGIDNLFDSVEGVCV